MKFQLLLAALLGAVFTQKGYDVGSTASVTLPTSPSVTNDASDVKSGPSQIAVPTFPTADLLKLNGGSTNSQVTKENIGGTINEAKKQLSTPVRSLESLFTRLPSLSEIDKFANDGDTVGILTTLKSLAADDSVPCGIKVSYLLELLGSVKNAISRKNLAADELVPIIDGAKAEIARLQTQISRTQNEREALKIPDIEGRVSGLIAKLNELYRQINAVKPEISVEEARVAGFEKELAILQRQNDEERNRLSNDKLKLTQTNNLIEDIQQKLKQAQDQKAFYQVNIAFSEQLVRENSVKIANYRITISEINSKINYLEDTLDKVRRQANLLEVDLDRARTDLSVGQIIDAKLIGDIRGYNSRINTEDAKLAEDDLKNLRVLIDKLQSSLPNIQSQKDRVYYYCYGAGKVEAPAKPSTVVFVVNGGSLKGEGSKLAGVAQNGSAKCCDQSK